MKIVHMVAFLLVIVGAVNWGLVGLGMLMSNAGWNVVNMLLGSIPQAEAAVYLLVGVSAVWIGIKHPKECKECMTK